MYNRVWLSATFLYGTLNQMTGWRRFMRPATNSESVRGCYWAYRNWQKGDYRGADKQPLILFCTHAHMHIYIIFSLNYTRCMYFFQFFLIFFFFLITSNSHFRWVGAVWGVMSERWVPTFPTKWSVYIFTVLTGAFIVCMHHSIRVQYLCVCHI